MKQDLDKTETVYFSNFLSKKLSKVPRNVNTVPGGTTATPADPSGKTEYQKKDGDQILKVNISKNWMQLLTETDDLEVNMLASEESSNPPVGDINTNYPINSKTKIQPMDTASEENNDTSSEDLLIDEMYIIEVTVETSDSPSAFEDTKGRPE
ncbi:hypothetical protein TNCT_408651 [Trichonephila clavata]|uniref:Uncharacterized protein n=1 Tax=Trichonephila clavata TaxID=2740835 RepID=A0A8X6FLD3_TRICU|nr:hypothetical protein TNCT_408651 [Trichonephila clavata]